MRRLTSEIRANSSVYKLFKREGDLIMYKQYMNDIHVGTEVGFIKTRKAEFIKGVPYPEREVYLASEDWGDSCWTLRASVSDEELLKRFKEIKNSKNAN